jgi:hypothetical protein
MQQICDTGARRIACGDCDSLASNREIAPNRWAFEVISAQGVRKRRKLD